MQISIIAAMAKNNVIGANNKMPWHLPAELQYFKKITLGKPVIMGRKTFESVGKPLPGRENIVITRQVDYQKEGISVAHSLEQAIELSGDVEEVMIIGGANIYQQAIEFADKMYLTQIDLTCEGDAFFPSWDPAQWSQAISGKFAADEKNPYAFITMILERKR